MNKMPDIQDSVLLLIDVQEKFIPVFPRIGETILPRIHFMLSVAGELRLPVVFTEQYPSGLGHTVPELKGYYRPEWPVLEKTSFSCFGESSFRVHMSQLSAKNIFIAGIETHVCVQQTACEALSRGYSVYPLLDALAARNDFDHEAGIEFMRQAGARVTTTESAVFMLMKDAKHPSFRFTQKLIKQKK